MSAVDIMGVLNVTPDSFSDGGEFALADAAIDHAKQMLADGATIIDVGGESTRPNAQPVAEAEELRRVIPVVEALSSLGCTISIDTQKAAVMTQACQAGARIINDVNAFQAEGALQAAAAAVQQYNVRCCFMHMQGNPETMQNQPHYESVVEEVVAFLNSCEERAANLGIAAEQLILDPGFGFGKTLEHNLDLMRELSQIVAIGPPVLIGVSRKSMLGLITGHSQAKDRIYSGLAMAMHAVQSGACIIRTHDVGATRDVIKTIDAINQEGQQT